MLCCFRQATQSPWIFHSTSEIIFSRPSQMIPVTVAWVTAQFLELSACPITSHIHGHKDHNGAIGIHTASTISHHLQQQTPTLCNTIGHCHFPLDTSDLVEEFNSEMLVLASDGSALMDDATQAWILYGTHTDTQAYGHGPVPGGGQPLTSLHAEVGGFVGGMLALDAILSTANNVSYETDRKLGALIDNKALNSKIQKWRHHGLVGTFAPDYDLLQVGQQVAKKHNLVVVPWYNFRLTEIYFQVWYLSSFVDKLSLRSNHWIFTLLGTYGWFLHWIKHFRPVIRKIQLLLLTK